MTEQPGARTPEEITRLFVDRSNAGDAEGVAALYEQGAVMAFPPGQRTVGRDAIRQMWAGVLANGPTFTYEAPFPALESDGVAVTGTIASDGTGVRLQVVRRQPDGTWQRLLDIPETKNLR